MDSYLRGDFEDVSVDGNIGDKAVARRALEATMS